MNGLCVCPGERLPDRVRVREWGRADRRVRALCAYATGRCVLVASAGVSPAGLARSDRGGAPVSLTAPGMACATDSVGVRLRARLVCQQQPLLARTRHVFSDF